jgi:hypothetical protein
MTYASDTSSNWHSFFSPVFCKSNRGSSLSVVFFRRFDRIRVLLGCRSEFGRGGGSKRGTQRFCTIKDGEYLDNLSGCRVKQTLLQTHSCLVAGFIAYVLDSNYERRCLLRIMLGGLLFCSDWNNTALESWDYKFYVMHHVVLYKTTNNFSFIVNTSLLILTLITQNKC